MFGFSGKFSFCPNWAKKGVFFALRILVVLTRTYFAQRISVEIPGEVFALRIAVVLTRAYFAQRISVEIPGEVLVQII